MFLTITPLLLVTMAHALWPPPTTGYVEPTCAPSYANAFTSIQPLDLTVTVTAFRSSAVPASWRSTLGVHHDSLPSRHCVVEAVLVDMFAEISTLEKDPPSFLHKIPTAVREDAGLGGECTVAIANHGPKASYPVDTSIIRDLLVASGVQYVNVIVVTYHGHRHAHSRPFLTHKGPPKPMVVYDLVSAAHTTAGELLVQPCSSVTLELRQGDERKCGRLPVKQLGTQASRQRPYIAKQRDVSSFAAHMTWIASLIQPCPSDAAMEEYKEEGSCHWLHIVPPSSQFPRTVFAYGAFNVPYVGDGTLVDASVLDSATEGWMPHPGYHFLTPSVFEVPLSAAMAARKGENYMPMIGPLGLEGTGHHMMRNVMLSAMALPNRAAQFRTFSEGLLPIDYTMSSNFEQQLPAIELKLLMAAGNVSLSSHRRSASSALDPIILSFCPPETGSFPENVEGTSGKPYGRYFPSAAGLVHAATALEEELHQAYVPAFRQNASYHVSCSSCNHHCIWMTFGCYCGLSLQRFILNSHPLPGVRHSL